MTPEEARKFVLDYYGAAGKYEQALQEIVDDLNARVIALEAVVVNLLRANAEGIL